MKSNLNKQVAPNVSSAVTMRAEGRSHNAGKGGETFPPPLSPPFFFLARERSCQSFCLTPVTFLTQSVPERENKTEKKSRESENRLPAVLANIELSGDPFFTFLHNFRIQTFY